MELTEEEYATLRGYALEGKTGDSARQLTEFCADIERRNGYVFYTVYVQWTEANAPLPRTADFPEKWPPQWRIPVTVQGRPVARADVTKALAQAATTPVDILVTRDPAMLVGWTKADLFFK